MVMMLAWLVPGVPFKVATKLHGAVAAGAKVSPIRGPHVEPDSEARFPYALSLTEVSETASVLRLDTATVKLKAPPGAGRVRGSGIAVTPIVGVSDRSVTVVCAEAITVRPVTSAAVA